MKKLFLLTLCALALFSCNKGGAPEDELADYTVIVYGHVGLDTDYEIEEVWEELKTQLPDKKIRVLALYKYGVDVKNFSGKYGAPGEVLCFELDKDTDFTKLHSDQNAGKSYKLYDPENIKAVLNKARKELPAREYVLAFFGHGGGFMPREDYPKDILTKAILCDDGVNGLSVSIFEIAEAIKESNIPHLKAILFNNCLMGGMESLMEVAPYSDYFIATPFLLTSENNPLIPVLVKNLHDCSSFEAAAQKTITDSEERLYDGHRKEGVPFNGNIELVKSAGLEDVCAAAKELATRLCELYPTRKEAIDKASLAVYQFYYDKPFYDLMDYASNLAQETGDAKFAAVKSQLEAAFKKTILKQLTIDLKELPLLPSFSLSVTLCHHQKYQESFHSVSNKYSFTYQDSYERTAFHKKTGWGKWLDTNTCILHGNPCGQAQ